MKDLPDHLKHELQKDDIHEVLNLLQVITSQCEIIAEQFHDKSRVTAIREAALQIRDRLKKIA